MSNAPFLIPTSHVEVEEDVKKSKFITHIAHTPGTEAAKRFMAKIKAAHPNANHNCWAFVAGRPSDSMQYGFSDDGEPTGTAGKPMLAQLIGSDVGEVTAVVTRYFGGIKLGTGGLVKAYGNAVKVGLAALATIEKAITQTLQVASPYPLQGQLENQLEQAGARVLNRTFGNQVLFTIEVDVRNQASLVTRLTNLSSGQIDVYSVEQA